jgi:dipeptidase E
VILVPVPPQNSSALASQFRLSTTLESHMVLEYARLEALRSGSDAFDARHLLLGVLALGERAAGLLHGMGMTLEGTRRDFKLRPERPPAVGPLMSGEIVNVLERTKDTVSDNVLRDIDVLEALTVVENSARPVLERYDLERLRRNLRAMRGRHLVAMGGGGFSQEPDNLKLDEFIVQLAREARSTSKPRVRFISTAAGDSPEYIERFYKAFRTLDCEPSHLALFNPDQWDEELRDMILDADVLYFSGGSTRNALALWREWDILEDFRRAYQRGTVIAGLSAGANVWFEHAHSDSVGRQPGVITGLGWLPGSFTPHYSNEAHRRETMHAFIKDGRMKPGYAADDGAALYFINEGLDRVVTSRNDAKAYRIDLNGSDTREEVVQLETVGAT